MSSPAALTFLFTDIEGSTALWERHPDRMHDALARHDAIARRAVEDHRGHVVKMTGDGLHAAFDDAVDALRAAVELQGGIAQDGATYGIALPVRCGMHRGTAERRDDDYYGTAVNRAARIMSIAHGGQVLLSQAVADVVRAVLPSDIALRELGTVRMRGLVDRERVFQVLHPSLRADFPALRALESTPNNLPLAATSFVGRARELDEVATLLRRSRLVTLLGAGGIGKSRLSLEIGSRALADHPDGVWFVALETMRDARLVPQAIAGALGVREDAGESALDALLRFVSDRRLLLILDNCEHVLDACATVAGRLLKSGAGVAVLASSREPFAIGGEAVYPLPTLRTPDAERLPPDALMRFEAVRLFCERASAARAAFALDARNAAGVARICRRLDGIALAIELAAARVRTLSIEEIASRLDDRFELLTKGERTALPRQQTLRGLIDWSYELLGPGERTLFQRLAVFPASWTLDAAEAIGGGNGVARADVLDVLAALVDKSLVVAEPDAGRYRYLETIREYARQRLEASGERRRIDAAHLRYYVALAEEARKGLAGPEHDACYARLDAEHENLLEAHRACDHDADGGELGLRLVYSVQPNWLKRGLLELGQRQIDAALARRGAQRRDLARCNALFAAGWLACYMARYSEAQPYLEECQAIAREIGHPSRSAAVLQPLAFAYLGQRKLAEARRHYEQALELARAGGVQQHVASALNGLAQIERLEGNMDAAESLYTQVVAIGHELRDREMIGIGRLNLAMVCIGHDDAVRARQMLQEAIAIAEETGSSPVGQSVLEVCAGLAALARDWPRVARFFGAAESRAKDTGIRRDPADEAFLAPNVARAREALGDAAFDVDERAARQTAYGEAIADARRWLDELA